MCSRSSFCSNCSIKIFVMLLAQSIPLCKLSALNSVRIDIFHFLKCEEFAESQNFYGILLDCFSFELVHKVCSLPILRFTNL